MRATQNQTTFMKRLTTLEPAPPWSLGTALIFVGAYVVLWIAALSFVSVNTGEINGQLPSPRTLAFSALLSGMVTTVGTISWVRRIGRTYDRSVVELLRLLEPSRRNTLVAIGLLTLGVAFTIDLIGALLRLKGGQIVPPVLEALRVPDGTGLVLAIIVAVVIQPAAEGLVFCGVLFPMMARFFFDNRIAILVTAAVYAGASVILAAGPGAWYALIQPFLMMLMVAAVRAYYKSTRAAILARGIFGVFFVMAALFSAGFGSVPIPG
jgi:hypothetical protein